MRQKSEYSRRAIEASFLKLLDEMPFEKITVKSIVDDCELTRNTFYNYFEDTYDIADSILREQMGAIRRRAEEGAPSATTLREALSGVMNMAQAHPRAVRHLFRSSRREELFRYFGKALDLSITHWLDGVVAEGGRTISPEDGRLIADTVRFVVAGHFKAWVEEGMQTPPEDIIARLEHLFGDAVRAALKKAGD